MHAQIEQFLKEKKPVYHADIPTVTFVLIAS